MTRQMACEVRIGTHLEVLITCHILLGPKVKDNSVPKLCVLISRYNEFLNAYNSCVL